MQQPVSVELVAMMDFQFKPGHQPKELTENFKRREGDIALEKLERDYQNGRRWLWYKLSPNKTTLFGQRTREFWSVLPRNKANSNGANAVGQFMCLPQRGVGVATFWASDPAWRSNPMAARQTDSGLFDIFDQANLTNMEGEFIAERIYPLLVVRLNEQDLTRFCRDHADEVAPWFTGGLEGESPERRLELIGPENNISRRAYERIFMRWTDALVLYDKTVSDEVYRQARCRAAQLFEHCILARRIFRTDSEKIARLSNSKSFFISFPRKFPQANRALSSFANAEYEMVTAPPVGFVEAEELVGRAIERCGVPTIIGDTRQSYDLLDRRLQLARGQWLAIVAVAAFLANAGIAIWIALIK